MKCGFGVPLEDVKNNVSAVYPIRGMEMSTPITWRWRRAAAVL
jgi:hypothetical protein